ncbi:MAG: efflux RND transporter permease subunit [Candidatus Absconditabacteria bacterium]
MFEKYFKAYRPFFLIIMILLSAIGFYSFTSMSKESIPDVDLPFFNISAVYPGADADTIEQQVVKKIEDKLPSVKNISTFTSISSNNIGVINLEFKRGTDKGIAYSDLKSAVDEVKSSLPNGVKDVIVTKTETKDIPIYSFSITGPYYPSILYDKVNTLEDDLKKIPGVDKVIVVGKYTPQVEVEFDYEKLKQYNLRLPSLIGLLSQNISQKPIDKKKLDGNLYSFEVRTYSKSSQDLNENLESFKEFMNEMPLINQNGNILRLKDLANVEVTHPYYQRLSYVNGENAITFMVYKVPGADILAVIDGVKSFLSDRGDFFQTQNLQHKEMFSQEIMIGDTYDAFIDGFIDTSILILIIATIFLGLRGSIAIAITFPFVYLLTFIILKYLGFTFNSIVSVALNLSLGIMVDNLIVMAQGFQDGLRKGMGKYDAIKYVLGIYWKPLLIGNLVTVSMFLPLGFMLSGKVGEFIKFLPITVNVNLIISIIVSFIFLPLVLSYMNFKVKKEEHKENKIELLFHKFEKPFDFVYRGILKTPKLLTIIFYGMFGAVVYAFVLFGNVDFMPPTDKDNIYVNLKYNQDVSIEENQLLTKKVYGYINDFFDANYQGVVKNIELSLGELYSQSALENAIYRTSFNPDLTKINIVLIGTKVRSPQESALEIFPKLKHYLDEKAQSDEQLKTKLSELSIFIQKNGPSGGKDVTFNISASGNVENEISLLASEYEKILPELKKIPGTYGWSSSLEYTNGKVVIEYDLEKLSQLNLTTTELDAFLYSLKQTDPTSNYLTDYKGNGLAITSINDFGKDVIPVKGFVNYTLDNGNTINFKDLILPGTNIYISELIKEIKLQPQIKSFQHLEGELVIKIEGNKNVDTALGNITKHINEIVGNYPRLKLAYGADVKDMTQSGTDMGLAFVVGFVLMFAILVLNFGNFAQPIIMVMTMPLFLTGALFFLLLSGEAVSMMVGIGFFGLIGVGLAHIIYLLNRFNELLEDTEGHTDLDSIILESVKSRLEPIFLTTTITSLGLFVLAYSDEMWRPFALSFAGGLIIGTTITLVFIPSALKIVYRNHFKKSKEA